MNINVDGALGTSEINNMIFGNKIALLCGDYLLSNSCIEMAALRNQDVIIYIYFVFSVYIDTLHKSSHLIFYILTVIKIFVFFNNILTNVVESIKEIFSKLCNYLLNNSNNSRLFIN